ncbi:hypothetical protein [Paenibacillus tyrfis]|nr:hypothetical protein [Paenibacillus tyrfis]
MQKFIATAKTVGLFVLKEILAPVIVAVLTGIILAYFRRGA